MKKLEFERFLMKFFADFKFHLRMKRPTCRLGGGGILEDAKISQKAFWISIFSQPRSLSLESCQVWQNFHAKLDSQVYQKLR